MATTAAESDSGVGGIVALIIGGLIAWALAQNPGALDFAEDKGKSPAWSNPCKGEDPNHVLATFRFGKYKLDCKGFGHINKKHRVGPNTINCIRKILSNTVLKPDNKYPDKDYLVAQWAFRQGDWARVVVDRADKYRIVTALTKGAGRTKSARWDDCVKGKP